MMSPDRAASRLQEYLERTSKVKVREVVEFSNNLTESCYRQAHQYDLTPLTWLYGQLNILPNITSSSSSSSVTPPTTLNLSYKQEAAEEEDVLKETRPAEPAERLGRAGVQEKRSQSARPLSGAVLDLTDNFKTEESKQLFLREAMQIYRECIFMSGFFLKKYFKLD